MYKSLCFKTFLFLATLNDSGSGFPFLSSVICFHWMQYSESHSEPSGDEATICMFFIWFWFTCFSFWYILELPTLESCKVFIVTMESISKWRQWNLHAVPQTFFKLEKFGNKWKMGSGFPELKRRNELKSIWLLKYQPLDCTQWQRQEILTAYLKA